MGSHASCTVKVRREEREKEGRPGLRAVWPAPGDQASESPGGQLETGG